MNRKTNPKGPLTLVPDDDDGVPFAITGSDETGVLVPALMPSMELPSMEGRRSPCLVVLQGPDEGQVVRLGHTGVVVIGRGSDAQLVLHDDGISRNHARIVVGPGGSLRLEDMGSRNGTFVAEVRVTRHALAPDDVVRVGASTLLRVMNLDPLEEEFQKRQHSAASRDALTGAFNRRHFDERLDSEAAAARRHGRPLGLLFMDVDNFKRVNDTYGHTAGDDTLKGVANALASAIRREDALFRYGGEEFAVVVRETPIEGAMILAERLRSSVAEAVIPISTGPTPLRVTISVGVAMLAPGMTDAALLQAADEAVYEAKRTGKNRVVRRA